MIAAVTKTFSGLAGLLFMLLMISQFIAYFNYTNMPRVVAAMADLLERAGIPALPLLIGFIIVIFLLDFIIPGVIPKWAIFAPVFIPIFARLSIAPQTVLAAYRIGDTPVNTLTPLMVYLPFIVTVAQRYDRRAGIGTVVSLMLPYAAIIAISWDPALRDLVRLRHPARARVSGAGLTRARAARREDWGGMSGHRIHLSRVDRAPATARAGAGDGGGRACAVPGQPEGAADVYPALASVPPELFGICVAGADGAVYAAGDADYPFTIMSVAKPFVFALVCQEFGASRPAPNRGRTHRPAVQLGDGRRAQHGRPTNPMVNSGAIATTSLVPGATVRDVAIDHDGLSRFAGRAADPERGRVRLGLGDQLSQPGHRPPPRELRPALLDPARRSTSTPGSARSR